MSTIPERPLLNDKTKATIVAPDGSLAHYPTIVLTGEEAKLLREYRKFKDRHRIKEANYCSDCWDGNRQDGMEGYVTPDKIFIRCRCRALFFNGPTY